MLDLADLGSGVILEDGRTLAESKINDESFIVVMTARQRPVQTATANSAAVPSVIGISVISIDFLVE